MIESERAAGQPPSQSARPVVSGAILARNTLLNLVGQAAPLALALVATPYLLSGLGADGFGVLSVAWIIVGYFMVVGFGRAATKYIAEILGTDAERVSALAWTAVAVQAAIGVAGGVGLALAAEPIVQGVFEVPVALQAEAADTVRLLGLAVPVVMIAAVFQGVLEAAQRFDLVNVVRVPSIVATFGLPVVGLWLGLGLPGIVLLLVLGKVAVLVAYYVLARRAVPELRRGGVGRDAFRAILRFGTWATVASVAAPLLHYMDLIALGMIAGVGAVGYYNAPFEVVTRLRILPASLVMALFPAISSLDGTGDRERGVRLATMSMHFILIAMGLAAIAVAAGAHDLLRLWLGPEAQRAAATATQVVALGVVANAVAYVPFTLIQGVGRAEIPGRLYLIELPAHALLAWLCVSWWGIVGAAIAWTVRVFVDGALLTLLAARLTGRDFGDMFDRGFRRTTVVLAAAAAAALGASSLPGSVFVRGAAVVVILLVASALVTRWALSAADRERLTGAVRAFAQRGASPQPESS